MEHIMTRTNAAATPATLASWRAPAWATKSTLQETDVVHTRRAAAVPTVPATLPGQIVAEVVQHDELVVSEDGATVSVVRGETLVVIDDLWLTPAAAHNLGTALIRLVEAVEATEADR